MYELLLKLSAISRNLRNLCWTWRERSCKIWNGLEQWKGTGIDMKNKVAKRLAVTLAVLLVVISAAGIAVGNYFYNLALNPKSDKGMVLTAPINQSENPEQEKEKKNSEEAKEWFENSGYEDKYMTSYDGLKLHAYTVTQEGSDRWVAIVHGYTGKALDMIVPAMEYYKMGYNCLLMDCRGHGQSEGNYIGMGWHDRLDLVDWCEEIITWNPDAGIILYGASMGGATVMMASGEELPANVKAIVEDCGYTSVKDEFAYQLKQIFGLPSFPVLNFASIVTKFRADYTLGGADAVSQLKKTRVPILFIHGTADTFVPFSMLDQVYQAAASEKDIFIVEGAGHGMARAVAGDAYWNKIQEFLSNYI